MTIEDLHKQFSSHGESTILVSHMYYLREYVEWLEQKFTQPCPSCKLAESIIGNLEKKCDEYCEEIEKHKKAIDKILNRIASGEDESFGCFCMDWEKEPCPAVRSDKIVTCADCWREWAYKED